MEYERILNVIQVVDVRFHKIRFSAVPAVFCNRMFSPFIHSYFIEYSGCSRVCVCCNMCIMCV